MEKSVKKLLKTGYGLGLLSLDQAKKAATKIKKELNLSEKESLRLARQLVANSEKVSRDVLNTAVKHFKTALTKSGVKKSEFKIAKKLVKRRLQKVKTDLKKTVKKAAQKRK